MRSTNLNLIFAWMLSTILPSVVSGQDNPYDVQYYDLFIEPDFVARTISLISTITIDNPKLEKDFSFKLNDHYGTVEVKSTTSSVAIQRSKGAITSTVEKPSKKVSLVFKLKGALGKSMDEDREVIDEQSLFLLWSDRFYPIDFNDWAIVKTTIVLPRHFQAIAPGWIIMKKI